MTTEVIADGTNCRLGPSSFLGLVAAVDGGQVILNVGGKSGVKVGDQLNVERVTKEIKDPSTGQVHPSDEHSSWRGESDRRRRCFLGMHSGLRVRI